MLEIPGILNKEKIHEPKIPTLLTFDMNKKNTDMRNIFIQIEPEAIVPIKEHIINRADEYDYILTFDNDILQKFPNKAYKYIYGTTRILQEDYENISVENKKFLLTNITGFKVGAVGHRFRHQIYFHQNYIQNIPILFYLSEQLQDVPGYIPIINNNPYLPGTNSAKILLFKEAQFSIVIENSRQIHYFTEKICDCVISKSIPIYYGCPNISDYFDTTGWIILENDSVLEFLQKLQILTPDYFMKYIDIVNKNYETVKKYIDLDENINVGLRAIPEY